MIDDTIDVHEDTGGAGRRMAMTSVMRDDHNTSI